MKIPKRIAQTLINSLKGGVVPRIGLPHITVGRSAEIDALLHDVDIIAEGGASFRFIVGKYLRGIDSYIMYSLTNQGIFLLCGTFCKLLFLRQLWQCRQ